MAERLKAACGADDKIVWRQSFGQVPAGDDPVATEFEVKGVAPVDQHENRLQEVVTIRAAPGDVQEQVEFGRCRYVV